MSITITCEDCGHRHRLERQVAEPCSIYIVCHACELPLQAVLDPAAISATDYGVWNNVFSDIQTTSKA